jgi:PilZ domain-containing protein
MGTREDRKDERMGLRIPVKVDGFDADGPWQEMTMSLDTSSTGVAFPLRHPAQFGQVFLLALPLPKRFRQYDLTDPSYRVYGVVRRVEPRRDRSVFGVMFLGKTPPRGFDKNPAGRYLLSKDPAPGTRPERRAFDRRELPYNLKLVRQAPPGQDPQQEHTVAENLSKGGARVLTSLPVAKGEIILVEEVGGSFRTRAEIKNIYIGKDKIPRLNLQFLDEEAPDRLIAGG